MRAGAISGLSAWDVIDSGGKPLETRGNWPFYLVVVGEFRVAGFPEN
jgi:hypothetical protein